MSRRKFFDVLKSAARRGDVAISERLIQRHAIDFAFHAHREECFRFARERQDAVAFGEVQRLHPDRVARQKQLARFRIPNRERKHAAQSRQHVLATFFKKMQQHFSVGVGFKNVSARQQFFTQRAVIVDFTVEDDAQRAVFVGHRLIAGGGEINDF